MTGLHRQTLHYSTVQGLYWAKAALSKEIGCKQRKPTVSGAREGRGAVQTWGGGVRVGTVEVVVDLQKRGGVGVRVGVGGGGAATKPPRDQSESPHDA